MTDLLCSTFVKDESLIKILVLAHHENSGTKADYCKDCSAGRAILPWERYVTSHLCLDEFARKGEALIDDQRYKKTLAIDDPAIPLTLKHEWRVDHHLESDGDYHLAMNAAQSIGHKEICAITNH